MNKVYNIGDELFALSAPYASAYYTLFRDNNVEQIVKEIEHSWVALYRVRHVGHKTAFRILIMLNELGLIDLKTNRFAGCTKDKLFDELSTEFEQCRVTPE